MRHNKTSYDFWLFNTRNKLNSSVWDYNILQCYNHNGIMGISFHYEFFVKCNRRKIIKEWDSKYKSMFTKITNGYNGSVPLYSLNNSGIQYIETILTGNKLQVDGNPIAKAVVNNNHKYLCDLRNANITRNLNLINRLFTSVITSITTHSFHASSEASLHYGTTFNNYCYKCIENTEEIDGIIKKNWIEYTPKSCLFKRVFNNKEASLGGRFYNSITSMSKKERLTMKLNGKKTIELDFSSMMPRMLYHKKGLDYTGDLYDVGNGFNRDDVKKAIVILINSKPDNKPEAVLQFHTDLTMSECKHLIYRIKIVHYRISEYFQSGIGLELQKLESDITESVMLECLTKKIELTSIHDAIITTIENKDKVLECMVRYYKFALQTNFEPVVKIKEY